MVTITVTHKDKDQGEYYIYSKKEVFRNYDVWTRLKTNSSDVYRDMLPDRRYTCKVQGVRWSFMSWYRNILWCKYKGMSKKDKCKCVCPPLKKREWDRVQESR